MDSVTGPNQQALGAQLAAARERLDALVRDLGAIDVELDALAVARDQHRLLEKACEALQQLSEIGGARLFWGDDRGAGADEAQLGRARSCLEGFHKRIAEIEGRREAVLDEIELHHDHTDLLEADFFEAQEEEERRQQEWIIEREISASSGTLVMPWAHGGEDDQRFRKAFTSSLLAGLLFALVVGQIDLPLQELTDQTIDVPDRVVRLMMQPRPLPPREEPRPNLARRKPLEEPVPQAAAPQGPGTGPGVGPGKGLLAFREKFSAIAEIRPSARLGSQARINSAGTEARGQPDRSMLTSQAPGSSGGINLAALSRAVADGGGSKFEDVQIARATSNIGGGGGTADSGDAGSGSRSGPPLGRTDEEIQIVFDRHKAGLYRLYNRELRNDPTLKGQMVLRIRIEPDGRVSLCELHATDMRAPELAAQVLERVQGFDFGAKAGIPAITILYPIDFLPAT